ncbi:hypothetical protein AAVH_39240, partial [Aphelenchoides avenae]
QLTDLYGPLSPRLSESSPSNVAREGGLKRKAEPDSDHPAKDIKNTVAKVECEESVNKRIKTEQSYGNLCL